MGLFSSPPMTTTNTATITNINNNSNNNEILDGDDYESMPESSSVGVHMMAGAMAGMMEHVLMYPLDSVKTRMQTLRPNPNASYRSVPEALYKMIRYEGLLRPIKGVSVVFFSAGPAHALYYSCYERMKLILSGTTISYDQTHLSHGAAGCLATLLHDAVMNPAEVIKQRMQIYNSPYRSSLQCMADVFKQEGFRAFYRSYYTSLVMNVPFQSIHFMTYEVMQNFLNKNREYNARVHVISGAMAGGFAAAITTPLDVCKTLINTQERQVLQSSKQRIITGLFGAISTIYKCCGVKGYFQGLQARVLYSMPATAISWSVYEFLKYVLRDKGMENLTMPTTTSSTSSSTVKSTTATSSSSSSSSSTATNLNLNLSNLPKIPVTEELSVK